MFTIIIFLYLIEPPDGITPTVGFSNANLTINSCNVTLYDLGGGVNVRTVWKKYFADVSKKIRKNMLTLKTLSPVSALNTVQYQKKLC